MTFLGLGIDGKEGVDNPGFESHHGLMAARAENTRQRLYPY